MDSFKTRAPGWCMGLIGGPGMVESVQNASNGTTHAYHVTSLPQLAFPSRILASRLEE